MPIRKCPKCDSTESYLATELQQRVTGSGGGGSVGFIGNELGESGITPMMGRSSKINVNSETIEVSVWKCKKCDTLLGEKDVYYTPEDLEQQRIAREQKNQDRKIKARWEAGESFSAIAEDYGISRESFNRRTKKWKDEERQAKAKDSWDLLRFILVSLAIYIAILALIFACESIYHDGSISGRHIGFGQYKIYTPLYESGYYIKNEWFPWGTLFIGLLPPLSFLGFLVYSFIDDKKKQQQRIRLREVPKKENTSTTRIKCPNCASRNFTQHFEIPNELLGSKIECPKCLTKFIASKN